jgi:hypothetical protein
MDKDIAINERKEIVKSLWEDGLTGSEIAAKIGATRNSVLGLIARLRKIDPSVKPRGRWMPQGKKPTPPVVKPKNPVAIKAQKQKDPDSQIGILSLKIFSCRYIVKDGDIYTRRYCGKNIDRSSYCADHYKLCYVPIKK